MISGARVLILEDEAIIAMELESRLKGSGFQVLGPVARAQEALELAAMEPPDVVLADVRIDGARDGIDVALELRERLGVPVVFLTAHMDAATRQRALASGPFGYLTKPVRELELVATLEVALHRHQLERELQRQRQDLADSEARFAATVEQMPDALLVVDADGRILSTNQAAESIFLRSRAELVGLTVDELVPQPWRAGHGQQRSELGMGQRPRAMAGARMVRALRADGSLIPVEVRLSSAVLGRRPVTLASVRDISERLAAQEELLKQRAALQTMQKFEALGRLAGGVAHDFNNVLTVAMGVAAELEEVVPPERQDLVDELTQVFARATGLTRELLSVARRQESKPVALDVGGHLEALRRTIERAAGVGVQVVLDVRPPLPAVLLDPVHLDQVVLNLVHNAHDAMPAGGTLTLTASAGTTPRPEGPSPAVVLEIRDTGVGMDAETVTRIFDPFFTTKGEQGTGLGLATVWGLTHQAGGAVTVESSPGVGTCFRVVLPAAARGATGS